jgi:hypothetical protein
VSAICRARRVAARDIAAMANATFDKKRRGFAIDPPMFAKLVFGGI